MMGNIGDYLCYSENHPDDIYIVKKEIFEEIYTAI